MSKDRELLELAAKAVGYNTGHHWNAERLRLVPAVDSLVVILPDGQYHTAWNPLTDDGDALRLAVSIPGLNLQWIIAEAWQACDAHEDRCAYVRRAIVRAAAEIGRSMP